MKHRGQLLFVVLCGILGMVAALTVLPPIVESIGTQIYSYNRNLDLKESAENAAPVDSATPVRPGSTIDPARSAILRGAASQSTFTPPPVADDTNLEPTFPVNPLALGLLGLIVGLSVGVFALRKYETFSVRWDKMPSGEKITLILGSFLGVISGILISIPFLIVLQGRPEGPLLTLGLILGCGSAMIYLLRSLAPYLPWETSSAGAKRRTGLKVLDTNVLIDGRVYDLLRTGFLDGDLYIPAFVLQELQYIADSQDGMRRQRGRRGLDVVKRIQAEYEVEVGSRDRYAGTDKEEVDTRLIKLSKALGADLVSNDFNLNRVASIQDVRVLNINDLALALRPNVLPGETLEVVIIKEGNQNGQGVGYLNDGTMVVVEGGGDHIGENITVCVTQVIQTERGKMIFADAPGLEDLDATATSRRRRGH